VCSLGAGRGGALLVEDYADRVRLAAGYLSRLLADDGTRVDNPADEPVGPRTRPPWSWPTTPPWSSSAATPPPG
jgi:hypothetical protein